MFARSRSTSAQARPATSEKPASPIAGPLRPQPGAVASVTQPALIGGQASDVEMEIAGARFARGERRPVTGDVEHTIRIAPFVVEPGKHLQRILPRRTAVLAHRPVGSLGRKE